MENTQRPGNHPPPTTSKWWFSFGDKPRFPRIECLQRFNSVTCGLHKRDLTSLGLPTEYLCLMETNEPVTFLEASRLVIPSAGRTNSFSMVRCCGGLFIDVPVEHLLKALQPRRTLQWDLGCKELLATPEDGLAMSYEAAVLPQGLVLPENGVLPPGLVGMPLPECTINKTNTSVTVVKKDKRPRTEGDKM